MARIRSIHPGLASDEAYMSMTMAAKAAWPLLWTECDDHGIFEWKPIVLKARIFPADNVDFAALLAEYEALGCVRRADVGGKSHGFIRNFCRYQRPKNPSYRFDLDPALYEFVGLKSSEEDRAPVILPQSSPSPAEIVPQMKEEGGRGEKEEETASAASSPRAPKMPGLTEMERRIIGVFRDAGVDPSSFPETGPAALWAAQGFDAEICVAVVSAAVRRGKRINSLKWFEEPIREAHAKRAPAPPPVDAVVTDGQWDVFVSRHRESPSKWPHRMLGPSPDEAGCKAPADILTRYGWRAAA